MSINDPSKFEELKATGQLPSPKGVAVAILRLSQQDNVTNGDLARLVKTDPAFAGRLIKAANGINTAARRPVVAVSDAILLLGIPAVRQLALGFSLVAGYRTGDCKGFDYAMFWSGSLMTAIAMQALTERTRAAAPEETFTSGLLARVGCLALATLYPSEYALVIAEAGAMPESDLAVLERQAFALDHAELTAALLYDWGIPKTLAEPVLYHENPGAARFPEGSRMLTLAQSLQLASHMAEVCLAPQATRAGMLAKLYLLATRIGIGAEDLNEIADRVIRDWHEWGELLAVPTQAVQAFAELASATPAPAMPGRKAGELPAAAGMRVLVVDDDPSVLLVITRLLQAQGHEVHAASNGRAALELALEVRPQVVVADWVMPEMTGIELCRALRETRFGRNLYILVLTSFDEDERLVEALEAGADDFVSKPLRPRVLAARLRAGQRLIQLQGEIEKDHEEIRHFAAELAVTNRRLQQVAMMDPLTDFPNRRYAMERLDQEWASAMRSGRPLACMVVDVDSFKQVNDTYGHDAGDAVLRKTSAMLRQSARAQDVICRIGGDEFLVICPDTDAAAAAQCGERFCRAVAGVQVEHGKFRVKGSVSIGCAARDAGMGSPADLIRAADEAMYQSKSAGRNRATLYRPAVAAPTGRPR